MFDESVELTALGAQGVVSRAFATQTITADGQGGFSGSGPATLTALDRVTSGGRAQSGFGAAFSGLPGPGDHSFFLGAQVDPCAAQASAGAGRFSFSFSLSFTDNVGRPGAVPEPHSLALALAGLAGCAAASRRHRGR